MMSDWRNKGSFSRSKDQDTTTVPRRDKKGVIGLSYRPIACDRLNVRGKAEYCALGDGEVDFKPRLAGLKRSYDGYYSIEYEKASDVEEGTKRCLDYLKEIGHV